jgi:hypothetical protein
MVFTRVTRGRTCPVCKCPDVYRVKRTGLPVRMLCKVLNLRAHWCPECDTFFLGPKHAKYLRVGESIGQVRSQKPGGGQPHVSSLPH